MNGSSSGPPAGFQRPPLFTYDACREIDRRTIAAGFPEQQLMGNAALASASRLKSAGHLEAESRLVILCGTGNNGGDGYALAYMLLSGEPQRAERIVLCADEPPRGPAARFYREACLTHGLRCIEFERLPELGVTGEDCVVEALLGIGQSAPPRAMMLPVAQWLANLRGRRESPTLVALDVPLGLREDVAVRFVPRGERARVAQGEFPCPDEIHSYGVEKLALRLQPDLAQGSRVVVLPIGFLPAAIRSPGAESLYDGSPRAGTPNLAKDGAGEPKPDSESDGSSVARLFDLTRTRPADSGRRPGDHKYSAGHAVLIGGSPGMEGALLLAARAFFAAGGGILEAHSEAGDQSTWQAFPATMFAPLNNFRPGGRSPVVAVGPGLSATDCATLERLLETHGPSSVAASPAQSAAGPKHPPESRLWIVDAGALPLTRRIADLGGTVLATPHAGEWARLGGPKVECAHDLVAAVRWNQRELRAWTLLKGPISCLFGPDGGAWVLPRPNAALATAGSGDVLTGILSAVAARRTDPPRSIVEIVELALRLQHWGADRKANPDATTLIEGLRELALDPEGA